MLAGTRTGGSYRRYLHCTQTTADGEAPLDDVVGQPFFIGPALWSLALRGPVLTKCAAGAALGYAKLLPHMVDAFAAT